MGQSVLSPPILATTIPAFYSTDSGAALTVPFSMSRAVGWNQISGFKVKIKSVQSGNTLGIYDVDIAAIKGEIMITSQFTVIIDSLSPWLREGQFYKVQIAYIDVNNNVGYYSSIAVTKYTSKPELHINHLNELELNAHLHSYEGIYEQEDLTERPYLYRFDIYNNKGQRIHTSGDLLHNSDEDDMDQPNQARDIFTFSQDLGTEGPYTIKYVVTTTNGLIVSSPAYRIIQKPSINPELNADLNVALNFENGYINISLTTAEQEQGQLVTGSFIISRSCEDNNFSIWEEIHRFKLVAQTPTLFLCKDFTIEQGKRYRYALQQYSDTLISNRLLSDIIYADFEDAFLYDGQRQLKIKYNPKVSSFKKDLLETKTDTIGGKHPFIFRNGRVYYSEFAISGLISYQMDEENLFLSKEDYGLNETTISLTGENIAAEREFKMKVLEWLTNGKPKVFRSPTEGNFIVRLMNSSLSPNDTLGRMLHTFTSTAYEIADYNYTNLGEMGFITIEEGSLVTPQWETLQFYDQANGYVEIKDKEGKEINLLPSPALTIRFDGMTPGDVVLIWFADAKDGDKPEEITIGVTGSYYIDTGVKINKVSLRNRSQGLMTYSYNATKNPLFNTVNSIVIEERVAEQFIGETDILQNILYIQKDEKTWVKNPKIEIAEIYDITVEKRPLQRIVYKDNEDMSNHNMPFLMYEVEEQSATEGNTIWYYDGYNQVQYKGDNAIYTPYIDLNGEIISVNEIAKTSFTRPGVINQLKNGNGCLTTITYQCANIKYNIEVMAEEDKVTITHYLYPLKQAMRNYNIHLNNLTQYLENIETNNTQTNETIAEYIDSARKKVKDAYTAYILALIEAQEQENYRRGDMG